MGLFCSVYASFSGKRFWYGNGPFGKGLLVLGHIFTPDEMVSAEIYFSHEVGSDVVIFQVKIHIFPIDVDILFLVVLAVGP